MEDRVERHLLGELVEDLLPLGDLLVTLQLDRFLQQLLDRDLTLRTLPVHPGLGPHVTAVPPAHEQVRVIAEDRGVSGSDQHVPRALSGVDEGVGVRGLLLVVLDRHPQGLEVLTDDGPDGREPAVVRAQQVDSRDAGLRQERLGLGRVLGVDRLGLLVRGVPVLDETGSRRRQAGHAGVADLGVVQRVEHRLPGLGVGEGGVVEHGEEQPEALLRRHLDRVLERLEVGCRNGVDGLHGTGAHRVGAGGVVGQDLPGHGLGQRRARTVVLVVALEDDLLAAGTVVGHLVGTASSGAHVELLGVRLNDRLGDDLDHAQTLRHQREGVLELNGHRARILGLHLVDEGQELGVQRLVGRVEHAREGEDDVVGSHGRAVGELRVLTQRDLIGGVVHLLGHLRRQRRVHLTGGRVELGEPLQSVPVGSDRQSRRRRHRVVAVGAQLVGNTCGDDTVLVGDLLIGSHAAGLRATRGLALTAAGRKADGQTSSHSEGAGQPDEVPAAGAGRSRDRH